MATKLPQHEMTIQEKLAAMEALWEDLSRSPVTIESPEWHKEILDDRRQRVAEGTVPLRRLGNGHGQDPREASVKIEILDQAEADLIKGFHFYEHQESGLGWYFLDSLFSDIDSLLLYAGRD